MFIEAQINGQSLQDKELCLTYDDGPGKTQAAGPGPRTEELAEYLAAEGIKATFFVLGKHVEQYPDIVKRVFELGHIVGNHSYGHPNFKADPLCAADEIARTDDLIKTIIGVPSTYVRPPYGEWPSTLTPLLNADRRFASHIGPIHWDILGEDYNFWESGKTADECCSRYLSDIQRMRKGIVLMHDSSADRPLAKAQNQVFQMTTKLIPALKSFGYRFLPLNSIPRISVSER